MVTKSKASPKPDYTISFATLEGGFQQPVLLGVEIQPPLDTLAAEGVAKEYLESNPRRIIVPIL